MNELDPQILRFDSLPSTNLEAASRAVAGAPEGLCIVAAEQTAGRGRLQRHWVSPKGAGLYFSIIFRPQLEQSSWPLLTLMAAVAVCEAVLEACMLETDIKWPNDILANEKKLCGILAETVETLPGRAVVVGIGINLLRTSLPPELEPVATSIENENNQKPDLEIVLQALVRELASNYQLLNQIQGAEEIIHAWCARSSYAEGKLIRVSQNGISESLVGVTRGLERDGALRVETYTREIKVVRAGDVTSVRQG